MAITVKKIELWNVIVDNQPGALAAVLEPLAEAGADLEVVMGTAIPGEEGRSSIGVFPLKGRKVQAAARQAGMMPAHAMPSLLVAGENRAGLGRKLTEALGDAGINVGVTVAQVVGPNFSALFGFESAEDATRAAALLRKVAAAAARRAKPKGRATGKPAAAKKPTSRARSAPSRGR